MTAAGDSPQAGDTPEAGGLQISPPFVIDEAGIGEIVAGRRALDAVR
jgi:hypothetical protein